LNSLPFGKTGGGGAGGDCGEVLSDQPPRFPLPPALQSYPQAPGTPKHQPLLLF
jgi:hypothetical protein